jgi:hypothetical protein
MANLSVQIKPTGIKQKNLVDLLYMMVASIHGICAKMDADGGVTLETYEANCFTAIFNGYIEDSRGNQVINRVSTKDPYFYIISPNGVSDKALIECIYQIFDMMETLTEQCDADGLGDSNYEALVYTAHYLWTVENEAGSTVGASTDYWITPKGVKDMRQLVDILYCFAHSIDTLTKKLDLDGTVTDTNYHALWDTAVFLMQIEDSKGNLAGNALTTFDP